ncbi:MFS general substrate transporter [Daldinia caldariorum]|uniref:MFS general substrate transporter n=1 Tax=Daldinia caldariorum TaxID=326644 RepID=UPI002007ED68|nr:MFS general substrate transporter [Daldinia caldariorum]KAI1465293.1 MFS general substrate transporter [Daldinia caldariorum]
MLIPLSAIARFAEPIAYTSVFPYLPEMISSFGVERNEIAKWAGITISAFSLSQSITAVAWGRASDRLGRRPAILTGLLFTMIGFIAWGMSTSLPMAITVRIMMGAGNGNVGIIRTMVAEMVTEKELRPRAFSIMPLVWSIGSVFGPAFGGLFAKPAEQWPGLFGDIAFFRKYPFAFPNLIGSIFFLISLTTGFLFLEETIHRKRNSRDWGLILGERVVNVFRNHLHRQAQRLRRQSVRAIEASAPLLDADTSSKVANITTVESRVKKPKILPLLSVFTRQSVIILTAYTILALHSVSFDQVLPVFLNYPSQKHTPDNTSWPFVFSGGFGLNHAHIGTIFAGEGIISGLVQFLVFPPLCTHFGVMNCYKASVLLFPIVYFLTPFTVLVEGTILRYTALCTLLVLKTFAVIIGFPCAILLFTNSAKSLSILGTLNGFATTFSALGRATGPAMTGAVFTYGVKRGIIGLPWWLIAFIAILGAIPAWSIVEGDGPSDIGSSSDSEDEGGLEGDGELTTDDEEFRASQASIIVMPEQLQPIEDAPLIHCINNSQAANHYGTLETRDNVS